MQSFKQEAVSKGFVKFALTTAGSVKVDDGGSRGLKVGQTDSLDILLSSCRKNTSSLKHYVGQT